MLQNIAPQYYNDTHREQKSYVDVRCVLHEQRTLAVAAYTHVFPEHNDVRLLGFKTLKIIIEKLNELTKAMIESLKRNKYFYMLETHITRLTYIVFVNKRTCK